MAGRSKAQSRALMDRLGIRQMADETIEHRTRPERVKDKIRATVIETMLLKHARGDQEMSATQIKALEILLDRRKPKLSAVDSTVSVKESFSDTLQRIAAARNDTTSAEIIPIQPQEVAS